MLHDAAHCSGEAVVEACLRWALRVGEESRSAGKDRDDRAESAERREEREALPKLSVAAQGVAEHTWGFSAFN